MLTACASPGQTTRMTVSDINQMGARMAQSLLHSKAIASRTAQSPAWIISIDKVRNLSSDVMTVDEQWAIMAHLRDSLPIQRLANDKNIHFVLPPERVAQLKRDLGMEVDQKGFGRAAPNHELVATFRSITRATADQRSDLYYCQFELINLHTDVPVWAGKVEFQRQAQGQILN